MTIWLMFIASGEACATCEGLHGELVEPGFKPHPNCNCNTVRTGDDSQCEFAAQSLGSLRTPQSFSVQLRLAVRCADGSTLSADSIYTIDEGVTPDADDVEGDLADLCDDCGRGGGSGSDDFLCC